MALKKIISLLLLSPWVTIVLGQSFLNGDFEINLGSPNTNYMMMPSAAFEATVPNCYSSGPLPNLDLLSYLGTFQPQSGEWFVGITPQDILTLKFDQALVAGELYNVTFYDMHKEEGSLIDIGVTTDPHAFGDLVYTTPQVPSLMEWKVRIFTFIAPTNALFLSVRQQDTGSPLLWIGVDNFTIESDGCTKNISLGNDTVICDGQNITLQATGSTFAQYVWNDGSTGSTKTITQPGIYWVTGLAGVCTVSDTITVTAGEIPDVDFESNIQTGCGSLALTFSYIGLVNHNHDYHWQFGDGNSTDEAVNLHYYAMPGCYDVSLTVTSQDGCYNSLTKDSYICIDPNPVANFNHLPEPVFVDNPTVQFNNISTGNITNQWHFGDGQTSGDVSPSHTFSSQTSHDYEVSLVVTSAAGCMDSITKIVSVKYPFALYFPNSFTPNDDGMNEIFIPLVSQPFDVYEYNLEIYNRWGAVVYTSSQINDGWKGNAQPDLYLWKVTMRNPYDKKQIIRTGHVMLLK